MRRGRFRCPHHVMTAGGGGGPLRVRLPLSDTAAVALAPGPAAGGRGCGGLRQLAFNLKPARAGRLKEYSGELRLAAAGAASLPLRSLAVELEATCGSLRLLSLRL